MSQENDLQSQIHIDDLALQIRVGDEIKRQRQIHLGAGEVRAGYIISQIQQIHDTQDLRYIGEALVRQYKAEGGLMPRERAKQKEARRKAYISRRMYPLYKSTLSFCLLNLWVVLLILFTAPIVLPLFISGLLVMLGVWLVGLWFYRARIAKTFTDGLVSLRRELERVLAEASG